MVMLIGSNYMVVIIEIASGFGGGGYLLDHVMLGRWSTAFTSTISSIVMAMMVVLAWFGTQIANICRRSCLLLTSMGR